MSDQCAKMESVELSFATKSLRTRCEDATVALRAYKPEVVESLNNRLADLRAADSPVELIAGSPRLVAGATPSVVIALADSHYLHCQVSQAVVPHDARGNLDWSRVRRLKITTVRVRKS